jgi:uncharacterized protein (DUF433 family)
MWVVRNKDICGGQPTLDGTRLRVIDIICGVYTDDLDHYSNAHELSAEGIRNAIFYCKGLHCQDTTGEFCDGCVRSVLNEKRIISSREKMINFSNGSVLKIDNNYPTVDFDLGNGYPIIVWRLADKVFDKYFR